MIRKKRLVWDIILISLFIFSFGCFLLRVKGAFTTRTYYQKDIAKELGDEEFDISLLRLNTIGKLEAYCDSFYEADKSHRSYPGIVSEVIRKKFYAGYSYYNAETNPMASLFAPVINSGLAAIVIPDDIVKYPYAACSQQSIVGMEVFRKKGYDVRKVIMFDEVTQVGHFAFEVYYDNDWHFFDTNQEPDPVVLKKYNKPSIAYLKQHPEVIAEAYHNRDQQLFQRLIKTSYVGPANKNPAPKAYFYQTATRYMTHFGWAVIWLIIVVRNRKLAGKPIFFFSRAKRKRKEETQPVLSHA